jgi:hypothetical protein
MIMKTVILVLLLVTGSSVHSAPLDSDKSLYDYVTAPAYFGKEVTEAGSPSLSWIS